MYHKAESQDYGTKIGDRILKNKTKTLKILLETQTEKSDTHRVCAVYIWELYLTKQLGFSGIPFETDLGIAIKNMTSLQSYIVKFKDMFVL